MANSRPYVNFRKIAPCLFAIIVDYMGLGLVYPVVTAIFTEVNQAVFPKIASATSRDFFLGLSYLLYPLCMFFGAALLGDLSDKFGRKKVLEATMLGIFVSFVIMTFGIYFHSIALFLIGRAFSGFMAGSQPLCMAAIVDLSTPENKAWNLSLVTLTNCIGLVFGPFIAGIFTSNYFLKVAGFPMPFIVAGIIALIGFMLIYKLFEETFQPQRDKHVNFLTPITLFIAAFKQAKIFYLWFAVFVTMLALMLYYQTIGIYMREYFNYTSNGLGFFYAYIGIFFAAGIWFLVPFALKRWSVEKIAPVGFIIMGICMALAIIYKNQYYVFFDVIPLASTHAMGFTAVATLFSGLADEKNQGWIMGILASCNALAFTVAGFFTNLLPFFGSGGIIVLAGILGIISGLQILHFSRKYLGK